MKTYIKGLDMRCPLCQGPMEEGESGRFETLSEHVSNPNGEPSVKQGYRCADKYCLARILGYHWLSDGEGPYLGVVARDEQLKWNEGLYYPRGSWHYEYETNKRKEERSTIKIRLFRYRFDIRFYHFKVTIWKSMKGEPNTLRWVTSFR